MDVMKLIREQAEFDAAVHSLREAWLLQDAGEPGAEDELKACRDHADSLAKVYGVSYTHVIEMVSAVARRERGEEVKSGEESQ